VLIFINSEEFFKGKLISKRIFVHFGSILVDFGKKNGVSQPSDEEHALSSSSKLISRLLDQ